MQDIFLLADSGSLHQLWLVETRS